MPVMVSKGVNLELAQTLANVLCKINRPGDKANPLPLPPGYQEIASKSQAGKKYFKDPTGQTTWDDPRDTYNTYIKAFENSASAGWDFSIYPPRQPDAAGGGAGASAGTPPRFDENSDPPAQRIANDIISGFKILLDKF